VSQIKAKAKTRRGFLKGEWEKAEVTQGVKEGFSIAKHSDGDGDLSLFDSKVALATGPSAILRKNVENKSFEAKCSHHIRIH
jgi:hypothetical protein